MQFLKEEVGIEIKKHPKIDSYSDNIYAIVLTTTHKNDNGELSLTKYYYTNIGFTLLYKDIDCPKIFYKQQGLNFINSLPSVIEEYTIYHD
jgi:hypothetical protein